MSSSSTDVVTITQEVTQEEALERRDNYMNDYLYKIMPFINEKINGVNMIIETKDSKIYGNMLVKDFLKEKQLNE